MDDDVVVHVPGLIDVDGDGVVDALYSIRGVLWKLLELLDDRL